MKKFDTKINNRSLVEEIVRIGLDINAETDFCVFFNFSGHVNQFGVTISKSKEKFDVKASSNFELYLTPYSKEGDEEFNADTQKITDSLRNARNKLKTFLRENKRQEIFLDFEKVEDVDDIPF